MKYPNSEIEKCENGYLIIQHNNKYVYKDFILLLIALAYQYDEVQVALKMIEYNESNIIAEEKCIQYEKELTIE